MTTKSDYLMRLKVISLGNVSVGKSCLIKRYCEKRFVSKYMATIGIDYGVTRLRVRNYDIRMNIFDFSGHPLFYEVRNEFYRDVQGILLVFDLSNRRSFDTLDYWLCEMKKELNLNNGQKSPVIIFVVGNKNDLKRVVDENEAKLWANVRGYQYFETSAATGAGVQELFDNLFSALIDTNENGGVPPASNQPNVNFTIEQVEAINRLRNNKDNFERLGLRHNCTKEDVLTAYKRLAKLLHPDKSDAPGSEDAFKLLLNAKTELLNRFEK
ncbi:unnamed protein product [Rotaria socialis]|uniref:J domain-containing protein n=1 Tax=Rotaria socialis TaxID=392032 RepID=A0A818PBN2_9BILA|nr:unnamed protein product [Rotaria socialis]CAF3410103.1 unnamed protein product [Rotaria socialis]CAF3613015.1 unnamed protein product [Rotaria socialis]CAF3622004.1 unnamed protein product [Rotaria socialis]CAF3786545.1 unnamed protein product [Rotaria socialis]